MGLQPLKEFLSEFGGWPVVVGDSWDEPNFVWTKMIYKFRCVGHSVNFFVGFSVAADMKNSTARVPRSTPPSAVVAKPVLKK